MGKGHEALDKEHGGVVSIGGAEPFPTYTPLLPMSNTRTWVSVKINRLGAYLKFQRRTELHGALYIHLHNPFVQVGKRAVFIPFPGAFSKQR